VNTSLDDHNLYRLKQQGRWKQARFSYNYWLKCSANSTGESKRHYQSLNINEHGLQKDFFRVQHTKLQIQTMINDGCPPVFKFQILME
jgi:hypothetical protein